MSRQGKRQQKAQYQPREQFMYVPKGSQPQQEESDPYTEKRTQDYPKPTYKSSSMQQQQQFSQQDRRRNDQYRDRRQKPVDEDYRRKQDSDREEYEEEETKNPIDISKIQQKELTEVLINMFKKRKVDCPICFVKIHYETKIWSCKQCHSPFHLGCIHKWIRNTNSTMNQVIYNWSCPKCNFLCSEEMPKYYCFCGQEENPEYNRYIIPHACGHPCGKKRGKNCQHPCPMDCHPGPCPECNVKGMVISCYCGKNKKQISCSEDQIAFPCQQICGKIMACRNHSCNKMCHPGSCQECPITEQITCFCEKDSKILPCGSMKYGCHNPCKKVLDCGNHFCDSPTCHESCRQCTLKPDIVKTCPCGKFELDMLLAQPRTSCLDPIPSCGTPQQKILSCGHKVPTICGQQTPLCKQVVLQPCRCLSNQQMVECWKLQDNPFFICDKVCKKKKSCQIHQCGQECCPAKKGEEASIVHQCFKECNKPLQCGSHKCGLYCHLGACQACPIMIQQPLMCNCGKTIKNPPNKCGTKIPECHETCFKQLPDCEHICQYDCHPPPCAKCQQITVKKCRCQKKEVEIQCFKQYFCGSKCGKKLPCNHVCQDQCPKPDAPCSTEETPCNQKCGKPQFCGHACSAPCHIGNPCPKEACKTQIRIKCQCGNREAFVDCGVIDQPLEKSIKCDNKCANIKRFGNFYNNSSQMVDIIKKPYYPSILLKFSNYHMPYLIKLEQRLQEFLINSEDEIYTFSFGKSEWIELKKSALQILLSRHYKLDIQLERKMINGGYLFTLRKQEGAILPKPKLSEYFIKIQQGKIRREISPFEAELKTTAQLNNHDIEQIENQIVEYKHDYYIEKHQGHWSISFWESKQAEIVAKRIKKIVGYSHVLWILTLNNQVLDEQANITIYQQDEIIVNTVLQSQDQQIHQMEQKQPIEEPQEERIMARTEENAYGFDLSSQKQDNSAKEQ